MRGKDTEKTQAQRFFEEHRTHAHLKADHVGGLFRGTDKIRTDTFESSRLEVQKAAEDPVPSDGRPGGGDRGGEPDDRRGVQGRDGVW
jgi:hypothetical protein